MPSLPLFTPAQVPDPSQLLAGLNALVQNINSGVAGEVGSSTVQATTTGTTIQRLGSVTVPGGTLAKVGQAVRVKAFGAGLNAGTNTLTIQVGSSAPFSVVGAATTAGAFAAEVIVLKTGPNTQQILFTGQFNAIPAAAVVETGSDTDTSDIAVVGSGTSSGGAGNFTLNALIVEQIK